MSETPPKILYLQYTNPGGLPPLQHSSRILAMSGWEILFVGIRALGIDRLQLPPNPRIEVRLMDYCSRGWRQKLHYARFCLWSIWWVLKWKPRWVYASDPLSCPVALVIKAFLGVSLVYHEHDSPEPDAVSNIVPQSAFLRACYWARRRCASSASVCVLPNQQRAACFQEQTVGAAPVHVVWNCPSRSEAGAVQRDTRSKALWVLYHGSIGPPLLPLTVIQALASLPEEICLRIIGYETVGCFGYMNEVNALARRLGIEKRIEFLGTIPRSRLMEIGKRCDIGLAAMPSQSSNVNLRALTGASNKPFDYLACGLPIIVNNQPEWVRFYCDPGYALSCDPADPDSIAAAIGWFHEHRDQMRAMGESGRRRILSDWNYETQIEPVLTALGAKQELESVYRSREEVRL
jgi:glycosyltransferase involved in cell wall biosynthesis